MLTRTAAGLLSFTLALAGTLALGAAVDYASPQNSRAPAVSPEKSDAMTDAEVRERGQKLIANQHKNDDTIDSYERVEHHVETTGGPNPRTIEDKLIRLVPNGAGATKLVLKDGTQAVSSSDYRRELEGWLEVLEIMVNPGDERAKSYYAKYEKRKQDRTHLVDALLTAYVAKWAGREVRNGRNCDVFTLTPDPDFHPRSIFEEALQHASAKIWVDRDAIEMVRAEALITSDVSVGGGVLGKLYKGGTFVMEQDEQAPGLWFPTRYQFDFSGRRFLFSFENHQSIQASKYRYIGSAKDALVVAQQELASGAAAAPAAGDP